MTQTTPQDPQAKDSAVKLEAVDEQLAARLVAPARERVISLVGRTGCCSK